MWPFKRKASSTGTYTEQVLDSVYQATLEQPANGMVAAMAGIANLYGVKLAECTYDGPPQITTRHLLDIGRDIPRLGCSHLVIVPEGNSYKLVRPIRADKISGAGWQVTLREGFKDRTLKLLDREIINFVFNPDPEYPWRGRPLWDSVTANLSMNLDRVMSDEARAAAGKFIWVNSGPFQDEDREKKLAATIQRIFNFTGANRGKFRVLRNVNPHGKEQSNQIVRIGPDWPDSLERTRAQLAREICAACNVQPEAIFGGAAGTVREGNRQFAQVMQGLCDLLSDVLSEGLGAPVTLNADTIYKTDLISRSRALGSMTNAKVPLDEAMRLCGFK